MSPVLVSTGHVTCISLSKLGWERFLELARSGGWEPAGTLPPIGWEGGEWDGSDYTSGRGQIVSDEDAKQMAAAMTHALADIPDELQTDDPEVRAMHNAFSGATPGEEIMADMLGIGDDDDGADTAHSLLLDIYTRQSLQEFFSGHRGWAKSYINFIRRGRFDIWASMEDIPNGRLGKDWSLIFTL